MVVTRPGDHTRCMSQGHADARILELAARQHGVVARWQLLDAGVSAGAIEHRLKKRTLHPVHRGVYRTGPVAARYQPEMAALLACGGGAALSHRTAAAIWGMAPPARRDAPIDVTASCTLRGPASGVCLHRCSLEPGDVTQRHDLSLTTPARTIFDLAADLDPYALERVFARALRRDLVAVDGVEGMLLRHPHQRGCRTLRALLDAAAGPALTHSKAEAGFLALLRRGGVPRPLVNAVVCGLEVDFFWPDRGVVVEVDGFAYHSHRGAFERDRERDGILVGEGLTVMRVTWRQIQNEPEKVLVRLAMALGARPERAG